VPDKMTLLCVVLVLYAVGTVIIAIPLAFAFTNAGDLANTTSGKILAAALVTLGFGALVAATDPRRHRLVIQMIIVFTSLAALAIVTRLAGGHHDGDLAWFVLPAAVAAPVLLVALYPSKGERAERQ
jgi:hypothetical protein